MYKTTRLSNGIKVVTHKIKERGSIAIGLWFGVGGRYEDDPHKGAAHFVEHIVFKGSQKYNCNEIKQNIEGVGGSLNAFTSEEQTCFYAKIPYMHLDKTFDVLADMVIFPKINTKDVNKEKTVILEEIKMYHDLPQYYVLELLDGLIWPGHPLGKSLAGSFETVGGLTAKDLRKFHSTYYSPGNLVVAACGKLSHKKIVDLVKQKLGDLPKSDIVQYTKFEDEQKTPRVNFSNKSTEQMHIALGMPGYSETHPDRFALSLLSVILGGNMSSRLFVEVREKKGLAYSIGSCSKMMHDTGLFLIRAGVDNGKLVDAVSVILKQLEKVKAETVSISEFKRAKDYLLGQLMLGLEDTMDHMLWIGDSMISKNKTRSFESVLKEFENLKPSDVKRVANDVLKAQKYNLAVVGPVKSEQQNQLNALLKVQKEVSI